MKREEQIKQAKKEYSSDTLYDGCDYVGEVAKQRAFIAGATWADETMKDKMVKWLETINFEKDYIDVDYSGCFFKEEYFINDFIKAMEE